MWGGHRLQNHPQNPSQNSIKCVNHPFRIGRGTAWSTWDGNATSLIPECNWARFLAPGASPTSSSSANQYGCRWNSKVHPASCIPSGPMAPNGKYGRYPEAEMFRITGEEVLQGATPGLHKLFQPHTCRTHPSPLWWSCDHLTHGYRGEWEKNEARMVAPIPNGGPFWIKLKKEWSSQKPLTPNSRRESGQHCLLSDPQDRRDRKCLWTLGRHAGWTKNVAGF